MRKIFTALFIFITLGAFAQPKIKGGLEAFVKTQLLYPSYSLYNCIEGQITLSFQLTAEGAVFNSKIQSGIGTDLDKEALRLIRLSSGKWIMPVTFDTTTVIIVPVNFTLEGYNCRHKSKADIQRAINAYVAHEGLTEAIQNFYKNKAAGIYTKEEEPRYLKLKEELGYDDAYMGIKIEEGRGKLKQNDKQGACEDFHFVRNMGYHLADSLIKQYCP